MRVVIVEVLSLALIGSMICPSAALAEEREGSQDYWVYANEGPEDSSHRYYGMAASNYVMSDPTIDYMHINSIYEYYDSDDYIETGWVWREWGSTDPQKFVAYERQGYTSGQVQYFFGQLTPGSNVYFELNNRTMDGGSWESWRANCAGTYFDRDLNFYKAWAQCSSERDDLITTNYGHWWNLKTKDYTGIWYSWSDGRKFDGDPEYHGSFASGYYHFYSEAD